MTVQLLTEHYLDFLGLKEAAHARLSLHLSKCHIVGNLSHVAAQFLYHCMCCDVLRGMTVELVLEIGVLSVEYITGPLVGRLLYHLYIFIMYLCIVFQGGYIKSYVLCLMPNKIMLRCVI